MKMSNEMIPEKLKIKIVLCFEMEEISQLWEGRSIA